jgi:hypothetical protein
MIPGALAIKFFVSFLSDPNFKNKRYRDKRKLLGSDL